MTRPLLPQLLILAGAGIWLGATLFPPKTSIASRIVVVGGTDLTVEVPPDEARAEIRFTLDNVGGSAIEQPRIQRSCNCIEASVEPEVLAAGASADIVLNVVLAKMENAAGRGTVHLTWADGSGTDLSFRVARARVRRVILSPADLTMRSIEARDHPTVAFVADYFPEAAPSPADFAVRLDGQSEAVLANVRPVGRHALAGDIVLDRAKVTPGAHAVKASGLQSTTLLVRN